MKTIQSCLSEATRLVSVSDTARLDAEILLTTVLNKERAYLYTWPEKQLEQYQAERFENLLKRRELGEPIAYIVGNREFYSLNLNVNASTLIPRPETEMLVDCVLELLVENNYKIQCLDLGTGTGAIALAIARQKPHWQITALEKNQDAVALAKFNQQQLTIDNVDIKLSDWFSALGQAAKQFDVIVSNPPYIDPQDQHLKKGDVRFEPRSALVSGNAGLEDIAHIIETAPNYLKPEGWLLLEHGYQQAEQVAALFEANGYSNYFLKHDFAGQPRVSGAQTLRF